MKGGKVPFTSLHSSYSWIVCSFAKVGLNAAKDLVLLFIYLFIYIFEFGRNTQGIVELKGRRKTPKGHEKW